MRNTAFSQPRPPNENDLFSSVHFLSPHISRTELAFGAINASQSLHDSGSKAIRDLDYAGTSRASQTLDVLIPNEPQCDGLLPAIVSIHGGAFANGDKSDQLDVLLPLVETGRFAGVSINYRLSGEALWPAQIFDCKAAIRWIRANSAKFGIDPDRIGVIGEGAGGNLAAMLGVTSQINALDGDVGDHLATSCAVQCVVSQFGPSDLLTMPSDAPGGDHSSENSPAGRLLGGALQSQIDRAILASPITYVSKNSAPFLLIHDTNDPVIPYIQSERMYNALNDAGAEGYFLAGEGIGHGKPGDQRTGRHIRAFFEKHLLGQAGSDAFAPEDQSFLPALGCST